MMKQSFLTLALLFIIHFATAQKVDTLVHNDNHLYRHKTVLADKNYTIEQIISDTTLKFQLLDSVKPSEIDVFWVKYEIFNPFSYDERLNALFFPIANNTLYFFNEQDKHWQSVQNGVLVPNNKHNFMNLPCTLKARQNNVLYIKSDVRALQNSPNKLRPFLAFRDVKVGEQRKKKLDVVTAVTVMLVMGFFLFNAYIYYIFRDKTYFYYLLTQIGGIIYMLSNSQYFNQLIRLRFAKLDLDENGFIGYYDLNSVLSRVAVTIILFAFIQLTRAYLNTREMLPKWDRILKYLGYGFLIIMPVLIAKEAVQLSVRMNSLIVDNALVVLIVLSIFYVTILRYRQKDKAARYFLFANLVPLIIILFLGGYFLLYPNIVSNKVFNLANIAVVAQAFCLALALVERFLLIRDELKQKELEAKELKIQNKRIASELAFHKTELKNYTQSLREKTEALEKVKSEIEKQNTESQHQNWLEQLNQVTILTEGEWRSFRQKFENVHTDFFNRLQLQIPTVTEAEKRLLALTKLEMSNSEIAAMLGISPESVTKTRYRLKKKVGEEDLEQLVDSL